MKNYRRRFLVWLAGLPTVSMAVDLKANTEGHKMYGLIGRIVAVSGKRDELASILINGVSGMPGCLSYIVAQDSLDENSLWITEVWENKDKHQASLSLESVKAAIKLGKPMIENFADRYETSPIGGHGV